MKRLLHSFEVVAAIAHYGELATSGHYRSFWFEKDFVWITDDAATAVTCQPADLSHLECNAYLIWAVRRP